MEKVIFDIKELGLDFLDNSWVEGIYFSEYLEFEEIPSEYDSISRKIKIRRISQNIIKAVGLWLRTETDAEEEKSWAILSNEVPYRKLLAVLGYHIHQGIKNVLNEKIRTNALFAARVYFKLLSIPGFMAYNIYHSQLFVNSLACLGFLKLLCEKYDQHKDKEDRIVNIEEQVNNLVKQLQLFMVDLREIMPQLQLGPNDMNFQDILNSLVDVTGGAYVNKLDIDKIELEKVTVIIYNVIETLLRDANKEPVPDAVWILFKCLHAKFVTVCLDAKMIDVNIRASYVSYCGLLLSMYGKSALSGFHVLLEHLCYSLDGLERSETRLSRVKMVTGLMSLLPAKLHSRLLKWLITLSKSAKIIHRQIAVDILDQMLNCEHRNTPKPRYNFIRETGVFTFDPGNDPSVGVIGVDAGYTKLKLNLTDLKLAVKLCIGLKTNIKLNVGSATLCDQQNGEPQSLNGESTAMDVGEGSQEPANTTENADVVTDEDVKSILQQRTIPVPIADILNALYHRVQDTSSTVRSRAIATLSKCLDDKSPVMMQALEELHGDGEVSRLMALAARCVCDERATVRRAGAALVHRLLRARRAPPAAADLGILVGLCRDASILVRTAAITALADVVAKSPSAAVFDAFLLGPMHQLSDPENKVQATVKNLFQGLLIDRIRKYSVANEDPIPWMLLGGIIRHNLRRHLQKACTQLAQSSNCISVTLVDCLSTHLSALGTARDVQALVMLTSVARHVEYSDVGFVLQYYYRLAESHREEESDPRLTSLTLELLGVWARFLPRAERDALRAALVRRLAAPGDDGCRIASATLAAQLDMSNLTWATELMQLAERAALSGGDVEEWVRAADLALVAPAPPSPALLQLFLHAIKKMPTGGWAGRRAGACVAGAGRLCVRSRGAAAALAPPAAALLHADAPLEARVNALLVLSDICTRYTNIVEPLMTQVCGCLDSSAPPLLRRHAARALTRLLLAGYLRLRTPLYYRYCALLADEDHDVREPAEYFVTCTLTTDTIYHHFVDCVQYYNSDSSEKLSFDARQLIYDVMLQRLSLVQRLNTQCRLAREVLEHAADIADDGEELRPAVNDALLDTITVLCGPRMRLPRKQAPATDDLPDMDIDEIQERVTTNIVSSKMKHMVAEMVVPAVLRLHARLRAGGGQLLTYLVRLATDLLNDYRQEIEELIETDEELVEQVQLFQETIGLEQRAKTGNTRNLVTSSAPPEPETPRAPRRRRAPAREPPRKRALHM